MIKNYLRLTKFGIVVFVLISGIIAFFMSLSPPFYVDWERLLIFSLGIYFLSSGSFILNQIQERNLDKKMKRTENRPLPLGHMGLFQSSVLSALFLILGCFFMYLLNPLTFIVGLISVILYNGFYTLHWKKKTPFAAILGAFPGAAPVLLGYSANSNTLFSKEALYLFLVLFLWQMPHFWALALKYENDYRQGGIPVLPVKLGKWKTNYLIGLYLFSFILISLSYPLYLKAHVFYLLLTIPFSLKCVYEFVLFLKKETPKSWLSFFIWVNLSLIAFLIAPLLDKMAFYEVFSFF